MYAVKLLDETIGTVEVITNRIRTAKIFDETLSINESIVHLRNVSQVLVDVINILENVVSAVSVFTLVESAVKILAKAKNLMFKSGKWANFGAPKKDLDFKSTEEIN
jgi:phosphorylcholine metabolism protein LicD